VLQMIREHAKDTQRIFVGVINPLDPRVETAEEVRDRVLEAAEYIPPDRLGTTDDCGFAPFSDDTSRTRETAFDKIRARVAETASNTWSASRFPGERWNSVRGPWALRFGPATRAGSTISARTRGFLLGEPPPSRAATPPALPFRWSPMRRPGAQWIYVARSICMPRSAAPSMKARSNTIRGWWRPWPMPCRHSGA